MIAHPRIPEYGDESYRGSAHNFPTSFHEGSVSAVIWVTECFTYVIAVVIDGVPSKPVKIGVSASPLVRLEALQTASPYKLCLVHAFRLPCRELALETEQTFHRCFEANRIHREWFDVPPLEAVDFILQDIDSQIEPRLRGASERAIIFVRDGFNLIAADKILAD